MLTSFKKYLQNEGWYSCPSFWANIILLGISTPFFVFPSRFPLVTVLILALWLIWFLFEILNGSKSHQSPFSLLILLFAGWLTIPILVTADPELTLDKSMGLFLGIIVWRFISRYVHTIQAVQLITVATSITGVAFVGVGFLSVDWLEKIPTISSIVNLFPQQIISFSAIGSGQGVQPNQLAGLLLWLYPFTAGLTIWFWRKNQPIYAISGGILTIIYLFILVLSQSRGGWLGGLAALGAGLWLTTFTLPATNSFRLSQWLLPIIVAILTSIFLLIFGPDELFNLWIDPPDESLVGNLGSLSFRQEVWFWALQAIRDFPITGTGLGTFREVVQRLYPIAVPVTYDIAHAHNVFLQVALDTGLIGLCLYLAILTSFFRLGFKNLKPASNYRPIVVGLMASFAGFHFYGLVDTISLGAKPTLIFWLLICIMDRISILDYTKM